MGGRGASANGNKHFKFSGEGGSGKQANDNSLPPAKINVQIKQKSLENVMDHFRTQVTVNRTSKLKRGRT